MLVGALGCRKVGPAPSPCPTLTHELDDLADGPRELMHRVDDVLDRGRATCTDVPGAVRGPGIARELARARLADSQPDVALGDLVSIGHPAIALRRAELLDRLGRTADAVAALAPALATDDEARQQHRLLAVSLDARAHAAARVGERIAEAPLADQPRLAHRAAADCPDTGLSELARAGNAELASAVADRLEELHGPAAAREARERAASLDPDDADRWDAVARARIASGAIDDALAAWDKAIELAPAQPAFRVAPIQALAIAGDHARAHARATSLAATARAGTDVELVVAASAGAMAAGDAALAVELAREAKRRRPGDGRLAFLVAQRLAEAGDQRASAAAYAELLVCGAHGRAWHRHEVAGRLQALPDRAVMREALTRVTTCTPVEPDDLATYVSALRAENP